MITKAWKNIEELDKLVKWIDINDDYVNFEQTVLWASSKGSSKDAFEADFSLHRIFTNSRFDKYWTFALKMVNE